MPERIPALEADVRNLSRRVDDLQRQVNESEKKQNERHEENRETLSEIKVAMEKFGLYFGIGRYVMHAVWAIGSSVATALFMRWVTK